MGGGGASEVEGFAGRQARRHCMHAQRMVYPRKSDPGEGDPFEYIGNRRLELIACEDIVECHYVRTSVDTV